MVPLLTEELLYLRSNSTEREHLSIIDPDNTSETSLIFTLLLICVSSLGVLSSFALLAGLYWNNRILLIPWMVTIVSYLGVDISNCIYVFIINTLQVNPMSSILFTLDFFLIIINIYCLLCVVSQYQELRAGRGRANDDLRVVPNVHYSTQPTATSFLRRAATFNETRASPTQSPTGTGPHTSMGTDEQSPNIIPKGPRKSVKFPDHESPTHNGRTLLEPWSIEVKAKNNADTAPLIETLNPITENKD
ncbi:PREDICTED: uncharacterized protein LOC108561474 [Nicrophorus vespilloides]|uniref:Uncharacterized protein LOC108561474 n=1 Tax=Nicrophorus vespilloides TaxID=110193 RepID=A0ABM1MK10_NICVS|nr:PREDICTED: uncharacterized protein LOC108561474 [Nicrophorus vespilloides]